MKHDQLFTYNNSVKCYLYPAVRALGPLLVIFREETGVGELDSSADDMIILFTEVPQ